MRTGSAVPAWRVSLLAGMLAMAFGLRSPAQDDPRLQSWLTAPSGRYARLVKEMSATVQFIYITHNKIAMEMADQLMGVTMHEPGCSRLVTVNVEEAVAMVEA